MPKPSELAHQNYNYRDYLLTYRQTQYDVDTFTNWLAQEQYTYEGAIAEILAAEWSIKFTPTRGGGVWMAATCKRSAHYLDGFTVSFPDVHFEWGATFIAFWVIHVSALTGDQIDDVLDLGFGALVDNTPGNGEKKGTEDDIPF